ncbi:FadR/GntR family transcriptional regulator [Ammoniphilus sp. 3BR4]|uniref:FadR/GntR family transcriptional regulator n=1 Tax=Ammoniphilus sp. 3BR4 TaxID=3158265 RepID=UPI0034666C6E
MFDAFKVDRKSISEEVVQYIRNLILQEKILPGEKIPGEREMAQKINVSRNTVREAYKILAAQGYLNIKHGQGVFISDEESQIRNLTSSFFIKQDDILELFSIRKVLETQAVIWAIEYHGMEHHRELKNILEDNRMALKNKASFEELSYLDQKFHLALSRMSGNSILLRIMMNLIDLLSEVRTQTIQIPGRSEQSLKEHILIVEAMMSNNKKLAKHYMLEHLSSVEKSIIKYQSEGGERNVSL